MNKGNHVTHLSVQQESQDQIIRLSDDGFVRMVFNDLLKTPLTHLISINEETRISAPFTQIFGYTEWMSITTPAISVGWDWMLSHDDRFFKIVRIGPPRSNLMFMDYMQSDIGLDNTETLINQKIDMIAWELIVKEQILKLDAHDGMVLSYS